MAEDTTPNPFIEYARTRPDRRGSVCWLCVHPQRKLMEEAHAAHVTTQMILEELLRQGDKTATYAKISRHFQVGHHERAE